MCRWLAVLATTILLGGCVGTLVKDLAADPATLSIEVTNAVYGTVRVQRSNVQQGSAAITKDTLTVDTAPVCPPLR